MAVTEVWQIRFNHRVKFDYNPDNRSKILHWAESNIGGHSVDWVWWSNSPTSFFYFKTEEDKIKFALRWA